MSWRTDARRTFEQRGQPRQQGAACDIGAFERARRRSVGIGELAPNSGGSEAGVLTTFTLTWTHPVAWRQLETLDLRFTGSEGALFAVRFTEDVTSTFSLLDEEGEVVGTAPAGSDVVLQTEGGALDVARSGFSASGPKDPSVVVTFAVSFTQAAEGHTYTIELLASDDGGQIEGPDAAGTSRVGPPPPPISLPLLRR